METMNISQSGIDIIKEFEGFKSKAYKDVVGKWTIGYGTLIDGIPERQYLLTKTITEQEAEQLLIDDIQIKILKINKYLKVAVTQNQFDSICDFAYNLGTGALLNSTLFRKLNENPNDPTIYQTAHVKTIIVDGHGEKDIPDNEFCKWINADHKPLLGLINRRIKESLLYSQEVAL